MFRTALLCAILVLGSGTVLAITPQASDVPERSISDAVDSSRTPTNETGFRARIPKYEIDTGENETLQINVSNAPPGTAVELSLDSPTEGYPPAALAAMTGGRYVGDGVIVTVSDDGTIPVRFPSWTRCRGGELSFVLQRQDTGAIAGATVDVVSHDDLDASFDNETYEVAAGEIVHIEASISCADVTLRLDDTDGPYTVTLRMENDDHSLPFWLDTAHPANASKLVRTDADVVGTNATVSAPPATLSGSHRLRILSAGVELATATLRVGGKNAEPDDPVTPTDSGTADEERPTSASSQTVQSPSREATTAPNTEPDQPSPTGTATAGPGFRVATGVLGLVTLALAARRRRE